MRAQASLRAKILVAVFIVTGVTVWHGSRRVPAPPRRAAVLHGGPAPAASARDTLRIGTLNIRRGKGPDGRVDLGRTAAALAGLDLVAIHEAGGHFRGHEHGQAAVLAGELDMAWLFAPTERRWWHDSFGNAILTRVALGPTHRILLPGDQGRKFRSAILTSVRLEDQVVRVLATHLDSKVENEVQLELVVDLFRAIEPPAVLVGDLNMVPEHPLIQALIASGAEEVGAITPGGPPGFRVEWIFTRGLRLVAGGYDTNTPSDHPLVWAELELAASSP